MTTLAVLCASVLVSGSSAGADSCMDDFGVDEVLARPDSAFVGVAREVLAVYEEWNSAAVRFDVVEAVKGEASAEAVVLVGTEEEWAGSFVPGGSFFEREAFVQVFQGRAAEGCTSLDPEWVDGVRPGLDRPQGEGPVVSLGLGEFRDTHIRLLNADGETVAYVSDPDLRFDPGANVFCADARLASLVDSESGAAVRLRDLRTFETEDIPLRDVESATAIRSCHEGPLLLIETEDDLVLADETGVLQRFAYGHSRSGNINRTGTHFSRWREFQVIETFAVDAPDVVTVSEVRNHTGWSVSPSPDGSRNAVLIWSPTEGTMTLLVAPTDGSEAMEVVSDTFTSGYNQPVIWIDDNTLRAGAGVLDLSGIPRISVAPNVAIYGIREVSGGQALQEGDDGMQLVNLETGAVTPLVRPWSYPQEFLLLPEAIDVTGEGYVPPARPPLPIDGAPTPSTLDEMELALSESELAGLVRSSNATPQVESVPLPDVAPVEAVDDRSTWWLVALAVVGAVGGTIVFARRSRESGESAALR